MPKFFWYLVFGSLPALILPAVFGVFGKEAEDAAQEVSIGIVVLAVIVVAVVGIWLVAR